GLGQRAVQQDVAGGAFLVGDTFALEVGECLDRGIGDQRVGAGALVEQQNDLHRQAGGDHGHGGVGRQVAGVDAPACKRGVHVLVFVEVNQFDFIQAIGLEQPLIFSDIPL